MPKFWGLAQRYGNIYEFAVETIKVRAVCNNLRMSPEEQAVYTFLHGTEEIQKLGDPFSEDSRRRSIEVLDRWAGIAGWQKSSREAVIMLYDDVEYRNRMLETYETIVKPRIVKIKGFRDVLYSIFNNL